MLESHGAMMGTDRQLWAGMLAHLKSHQPTLCRQWFEELEPLGIDSGVFRLRARTGIHRDYLQRQCADAFSDAARTVTKLLISVTFLGPEDEAPRVRPAPSGTSTPSSGTGMNGASTTEIKPIGGGHNGHALGHAGGAARNGVVGGAPNGVHIGVSGRSGELGGMPPRFNLVEPPARPATESLVINPDYSFEHFVVGPGNRLAHAAAMAVATNPGRAYNPYFVHGGVGLGKTHLLQAICLRIKEQHPDVRIFYTSCEAFVTQFFDAVQAGEMTAFRHRFRDVDLLVIDDIHFLAKRERTQEEFFHTFNALYQQQRQIVLSSDAPPEDIPELEDRLVSRFKWGLVAQVAAPCFETRMEILKSKARMRGFEIPDDVASHIAAKIDTNIRELEGAVVQLHARATHENRPIDLALARQALGEDAPRGERRVEIQTIISTVTEFYGVKITDLQSKRRQRSIALPRQVCMFLARRHTRYSLEEIGGYFGGRDHTTVMHAVKTIEERRETDNDFTKVLETLEGQLLNGQARA